MDMLENGFEDGARFNETDALNIVVYRYIVIPFYQKILDQYSEEVKHSV
jgi:hypothetical protein